MNKKNIYEVEVTKKISGKDCTELFSLNDNFTKRFAIVKILDKEYAIIEKETKKCVITFLNLISLSKNICLMLLEEEKYVLFRINNNGEITFSEEFKEVIKNFKAYLLIKTMGNERRLVSISDYSENMKFEEWPENMPMSGAKDHAIMALPNGNKLILLKEGLIYSDTEFDSIESQNTGNKYRIVQFATNKERAVIRIPSLEESPHYERIRILGTCFIKNEYLYVNDGPHNGTALMRISDFEVSKFYAKLLPIADNYAIVKETDDGPETILRLSDFKEAKFD